MVAGAGLFYFGQDAKANLKPQGEQAAVAPVVKAALLTVPSVATSRSVARRSDPSGPTVRIPFAVFKPAVAGTLPPVVYLTGGPGETWKESLPAVQAGSTMVRVGTAIFGGRTYAA